jgi:heme-degrading monooxygenase HmoA
MQFLKVYKTPIFGALLTLGCASSTPSISPGTGGGTDAGTDAGDNAAAVSFDPEECRAVVVQKDLKSLNPEGFDKPPVDPIWFGPSVNPATGKPDVPAGAILTSTYLQLKPDAKAQQRFAELATAVGATLQSSPGLLAGMIVNSQKCAVSRTVTIWKDEPSLLAFISTKAHTAAVAGVGEISRGGSITTNWLPKDASEASLQGAAAQFVSHKGPVY